MAERGGMRNVSHFLSETHIFRLERANGIRKASNDHTYNN